MTKDITKKVLGAAVVIGFILPTVFWSLSAPRKSEELVAGAEVVTEVTAMPAPEDAAIANVSSAEVVKGASESVGNGVDRLPAAAEDRPNVILIMIDDAGLTWAPVPTPSITKLVSSGTKFGQSYGQPNCSPARAQLMTSQYSGKWGHTSNPPKPIPAAIETWPKLLRSSGVHTGFVGKWHIEGRSPSEAGFDATPLYFLEGHHDYFDNATLLSGNGPAPKVADHLTDRFAAAAVKFINNNKGKADPFFLYLAPNAVHLPDQTEARFQKACASLPNAAQRAYCGNVLHVDELVGKVVAAAPANTLIIFTADNGCTYLQPACHNGQLRGSKNSTFEGGIRVPLAMSWKGVIPANTTFRQPVSHRDLGPTILSVMKAQSLKTADGKNILPAIVGKAPLPERHLLNGGDTNGTIRNNRWKWRVTGELFDLQNDPGEKIDVASKNRDVAAELKQTRESIARDWK